MSGRGGQRARTRPATGRPTKRQQQFDLLEQNAHFWVLPQHHQQFPAPAAVRSGAGIEAAGLSGTPEVGGLGTDSDEDDCDLSDGNGESSSDSDVSGGGPHKRSLSREDYRFPEITTDGDASPSGSQSPAAAGEGNGDNERALREVRHKLSALVAVMKASGRVPPESCSVVDATLQSLAKGARGGGVGVGGGSSCNNIGGGSGGVGGSQVQIQKKHGNKSEQARWKTKKNRKRAKIVRAMQCIHAALLELAPALWSLPLVQDPAVANRAVGTAAPVPTGATIVVAAASTVQAEVGAEVEEQQEEEEARLPARKLSSILRLQHQRFRRSMAEQRLHTLDSQYPLSSNLFSIGGRLTTTVMQERVPAALGVPAHWRVCAAFELRGGASSIGLLDLVVVTNAATPKTYSWNLQRVAAHGRRTDFRFEWTARFFDPALLQQLQHHHRSGGSSNGGAVAFGRWRFSDGCRDFFVPLACCCPD